MRASHPRTAYSLNIRCPYIDRRKKAEGWKPLAERISTGWGWSVDSSAVSRRMFRASIESRDDWPAGYLDQLLVRALRYPGRYIIVGALIGFL
jgi:hypothetical protein